MRTDMALDVRTRPGQERGQDPTRRLGVQPMLGRRVR